MFTLESSVCYDFTSLPTHRQEQESQEEQGGSSETLKGVRHQTRALYLPALVLGAVLSAGRSERHFTPGVPSFRLG